MAAPKGNQFWLARTSHGRKKIFADAKVLWKACCEYFEWVEANPLYEAELVKFKGDATLMEVPKMRPMTLGGLCVFLGIDRKTWINWRNSEDFFQVVMQVDEVIYNQKFSGAAAELFNASIISRDLGLKDRHDLSSEDGSMTPKGLGHFYGEQSDDTGEG